MDSAAAAAVVAVLVVEDSGGPMPTRACLFAAAVHGDSAGSVAVGAAGNTSVSAPPELAVVASFGCGFAVVVVASFGLLGAVELAAFEAASFVLRGPSWLEM